MSRMLQGRRYLLYDLVDLGIDLFKLSGEHLDMVSTCAISKHIYPHAVAPPN